MNQLSKVKKPILHSRGKLLLFTTAQIRCQLLKMGRKKKG